MAIAPTFNPNLFIVPRGAYQWVTSRIKRWEETQADEPHRELWRVQPRRGALAPGDRVLSLAGERGTGKSWLLAYVAQHDRHLAPLAAYLDLEERLAFAEAERYLQAVKERLEALPAPRPILLLDAVPPQLDEHLRLLEDAVLRPHLAKQSSFVLMALEHPSQVCWRAPALREGGSYRLPPFEEPQTCRQLERLQQSGLARRGIEAGDLLSDAAGLPLLNYLLATRERLEAFELLLEHWFTRIPAEDCERVRHYLVAVCPLEVLEHVSIQKMLEVYYHCSPEAAGYPAHASGVRNALQKYWLARPLPGSPGRVVLVSSVRHAAEELLKMKDAPLYTVLKEMASILAGGER